MHSRGVRDRLLRPPVVVAFLPDLKDAYVLFTPSECYYVSERSAERTTHGACPL